MSVKNLFDATVANQVKARLAKYHTSSTAIIGGKTIKFARVPDPGNGAIANMQMNGNFYLIQQIWTNVTPQHCAP